MSALDALFAPRRLALLGVSRDPAKLGHTLLKNVLTAGFPGELLVVNPSGEAILGVPTQRRISDLPADIDLALVSLPPPAVLDAVRELAARRTRVGVILTSGFGEVDDAGRSAQAALLAAARSGALRLIGPNCMGVYSRAARLNGTYFWDLPDVPGGVGVVSQSGAYGGLIMRHLGEQGIGISRFVSIGNQADLEIADVLEYFAGDDETRVVACFIEAVRDGRRFVEAAARVTARKPMAALKAGRTVAGRRAAGSHTGSLAGTEDVYRAAFLHAGVVACGETDEFLDCLQALATDGVRPSTPSVAVVTVSGGPSVIAADTAEALGLHLPALSLDAQAALRSLLPPFAAVGNPVDLTPQVNPQLIADSASLVLAQESIGGAIAVNIGLDIPEFAAGVVAAARSAGKSLVACAVDVPRNLATFRAAGVPVYPTPDRAVRAYRGLLAAARGPLPSAPRRLKPVLRVELESILASAHGPMPYDLARELLAAYGVRFGREALASSMEEAVDAALKIGFPVALKSATTGVLHKTELGGVMLGLRDQDDVRAAGSTITARTGTTAFLVQEQVPPGTELLLGSRRDEVFGPIVVVGLGGFLAEAVRDVSLALAPVSLELAQRLVPLGLRGRLVSGYRGLPQWDVAPVARTLVAVGLVLIDHPRIREIDINPVIARGADATAVDALVILE